MIDWKQLAAVRGVKLSDEDRERVVPILDRHRTAFAALRRRLNMQCPPACLFIAASTGEPISVPKEKAAKEGR